MGTDEKKESVKSSVDTYLKINAIYQARFGYFPGDSRAQTGSTRLAFNLNKEDFRSPSAPEWLRIRVDSGYYLVDLEQGDMSAASKRNRVKNAFLSNKDVCLRWVLTFYG